MILFFAMTFVRKEGENDFGESMENLKSKLLAEQSVNNHLVHAIAIIWKNPRFQKQAITSTVGFAGNVHNYSNKTTFVQSSFEDFGYTFSELACDSKRSIIKTEFSLLFAHDNYFES